MTKDVECHRRDLFRLGQRNEFPNDFTFSIPPAFSGSREAVLTPPSHLKVGTGLVL